MRPRYYVDTSVYGACFEQPTEGPSRALLELQGRGRVVFLVSSIVAVELARAPDEVRALFAGLQAEGLEYLDFGDEAESLAAEYLQQGALPAECVGDSYHIALATLARADAVVSWNFKHIVNLNRCRAFNSVNLRLGYGIIDVRSPVEVLEP